MQSLNRLTKRIDLIFPIILSIIINYLWYRGLPIYAGDQGIFIGNGVKPDYLINPVLYAFTNYPYGFVPSEGGTSWVNLIFLPFVPLGNLGEEVFSTILSAIGSIYLFKLSSRYYSLFPSILAAFLYLTNWFIFIGFIEMPYIFWNITFIYFFLPLIVYYSLLLGEGKTSFFKAYPIITVLTAYCLASSGEIFPIAWLGFVLLIGYYLRNKVIQFIIIVLSFTISQFYWIFSFASYIIPKLQNITNASTTLVLHLSSSPLYASVSSYLPSVTPVGINFIFLIIMSFISLLALLLNRHGDIKYLSLLWLIILGFDSISPWSPIEKFLVSHYAFFAVLRTTQFATAPFAGFLFSIIIPSLIKKYNMALLILLLILFSIFNLPILSGQLANRVDTPSYFLQAINYLNHQQGDFTILVFPTVQYGWYSTTWYYGNNIYLYYSTHPILIGGIYSGAYFYYDYYKLNFLLYNLNISNRGEMTEIYNFLLLFNAKYIIIEGDAHSNISFISLLYLPVKPYIQNLNYLQKLGWVSLVKTYGPLYIYKVNLNSSYAYYTNISSLPLNENLSQILIPAKINWISPTEFEVPSYNSKYVLITFAYSPYWVSNFGKPGDASNFTVYYSGSKELIIHDALQGELIKDDIFGFLSIIIPVIISGIDIVIIKRKIFK
ncbi:hypothetical protein [Sulfurisphaera tokodaii]|uniref:Uncharacterized protein n=2 Tax=Sulfurisphaera tokodaii TaxID=111955 RepID=Q973L1_SULTO|nr:hypothetical protein [Sulfurisphaera tokodaii]BAB65901.1 hypothetical protein STK_08870 [Sulfurisphaera tokodaii str. 7]HII73426.1 hypothetical protein [Sulfurisphaera tokodaii]